MSSFVNGCVFTPASSGTGSFVVSAAVTGWQTPAQASAANGAQYSYRAWSADNTQWEIGVGVYTSGTVTLTRTPTASSNAGSAVNFTVAPSVALTVLATDLTVPTSLSLVNATGLAISTGVSGLGTGVATFLATPSSANLISAVTDETGSGALVFANTPTLVTPVLGAATGTSLSVSGALTSTAGVLTASGTGTHTLAGPLSIAGASAGQIVFPATQNASANANTLDDYEKGTFTPVVQGITTAGVGTYTSQIGRYTKVGRLVSVEIELTWTAHTGTGNMQVSGFPFSSGSAATFVPLTFEYQNFTYTGVPFIGISGGNATALPLMSASNAGVTAFAMDTAATFWIGGTYQTT